VLTVDWEILEKLSSLIGFREEELGLTSERTLSSLTAVYFREALLTDYSIAAEQRSEVFLLRDVKAYAAFELSFMNWCLS
jgi:hypothetical protein